jgi:dipeptidyl aminopeptidase/acylaminoacyl peptidase
MSALAPARTAESPAFAAGSLPSLSFAAACATLLGWLAGCAATAGDVAPAGEGEPALEAIFLIPGIHGEPPRIRSISADGAWLLVDWRPVVRGPDGERAWGDDQGPHLLSSSIEDVVPDAATSLRGKLERHERAVRELGAIGARLDPLEGWQPGAPGTSAWSHRGHRLAVEWERAIVVLDGPPDEPGGVYRVLYRDPPPEASAAGDGGGGEAKERAFDELPSRLGNVTSLAFSDDDRELEVRTSDELFVFPLEGKPWPLALSDAKWPTRALAAGLDGVQLSRDRATAFARDKALGKLAGGDDAAPGEAAAQLDAQIFHLDAGRAVALAGWKPSLEGARLSPDGRWVFAVDADRSQDPRPTIVPNFLSDRVSTIESRRELADDVAPPRALAVWSTADGSRREVQLPGEARFALHEVGWAPLGPPRFAFRRVASDFRTVETWVWSESGPARVLVERDPRWVGGPAAFARWSGDGERLLLGSECHADSTTPGRCQVFALDPASGATTQLTEVEGEVSRFAELDDGSLVVQASRADPGRRELARVVLGPPPVLRWLPVAPGMNEDLEVPGGGGTLAYRHQSLGRPAELHAIALDGSGAPRRLTRTIPEDYLSHPWILPQRVSAAHADGTQIHAHAYLPRSTSLARPDRPRPCVVFIHGAGYLQNVTDSMTEYPVNLLFHSRLASMGYVVADVDYRGSAGYGARFRGEVQFQLGRLELEDIAAVVDELARRGVIDPRRVACYGGSYGGFLTLMALFVEPERWVAGAALRSVTDWRTYHPGYTQPRLGRPSTHPEAYSRSSPIDRAEGLVDPLLILHGMVDTNVFAQDSIRLIEKLIDLGKDFDAMLYPSQGHGFADGMHWLDEYRRIERFLVEHLGRA